MSFTVRIDMAAFDSSWSTLLERKKSAIDAGLHRWAEDVRTIMMTEAPVKTGALRQSITVTKEGDSYIIGPTVPYAVYVERGTAPHEIVARYARALRFMWRGSVVYFRRVFHPGTRPNPFVARSRGGAEAIAEDAMAATLKEALET